MESASRFGTPLEGAVNSDAIEDVLGAAWDQGRADGAIPAVRASVLSLVVCVADPGAVDRVFDVLGHLSRLHPARTIVLLPDLPDAAADQNVWYSAECVGTGEEGQLVCSERVVISAQGHAVRHLASLTDQLVLADLPVVLWWVGDLAPRHDALSERLAELADRLLVDSGDFHEPPVSFARVHWIGRQRHLACAVSDLNWVRLNPWRELLAQFFVAPACRPYEARLDQVHLHYADRSLGEAQALLLLGWLAGRLGWRLEEAGRFAGEDGRSVTVKVERGEDGNLTGLRRVALAVAEEARFRIARQDDDAYAVTEVDLADTPSLRRVVRFETADLGTLLAAELLYFGRDWVYEEALALAVAQIRAGRSNSPIR